MPRSPKSDPPNASPARLTPREALRRFQSPEPIRPTRRQWLGGLAAGAASVGCSTNEGQHARAGNMPPPGSTAAPGADTAGETAAIQPPPAPPAKQGAYDLVELGSTGIVVSRVAMGSGTNGYNGSSVQTRMGAGFTQLLVDGYDRGVRFFETADAYGSHRLVGEAMRQVGRHNVTVLTKTMAETREEAEADLARFLEELGTDTIDIVLLHIRTSAAWTTEGRGAMEVLAEAKARGQIRAHGVSCHSLEALELAAQTDWVDVDLARINPFSLHMDANPTTVASVLDRMKASGKGVLGMKILGQGDAVDRFDQAIEHAARLECIHGFTIGFTSIEQLDQVATKMASVYAGDTARQLAPSEHG